MNDGSVSPDLYQFFAAYFHQDWVLEADDWEGIVDGYVNDDPVAAPLRALAQEIENLRVVRTEPDLKQLMARTIGAYYNPRPLSYKEWLGQVAERLRLHAGGIAANRSTP